jgi:hypothetical protein
MSKKKIIELIERIQEGERLVFEVTDTFGFRITIIQLNPRYPHGREKKYLLRLGKVEGNARNGKSFIASDEAPRLADWLLERSPVLLESPLDPEEILAA